MKTIFYFRSLLFLTALLFALSQVSVAGGHSANRSVFQDLLGADSLVRMNELAQDFGAKGQADSVEKYSKLTYDIAKRDNDYKHLSEAADRLAVMYESKGDLRKALEFYKSARNSESALYKESSVLSLLETEKLKTEYTTKQAEALDHQQSESRKSTLMIIGIFSLAVISKTFLLYIIIRRKKTHNKELRIVLDQVERQNLQLDEGYRFKQHLISVVAHDLRTPVASIISLLKMFEDGYLSETDTKDMLQKARKEMYTLKKFLDEMLTWIVGQRDGLRSALETFDMATVVNETVDIYRRRAQKKQIVLKSDVSPDVFVRADKQMIKITINNLLNNALKFCSADDKICISVKQIEGKKVRVMISDTGMGFDTKIERKLTELSQKGVLGTWGEKATGIGLSLCILYLNANNTHLNLKSEPGAGAQFWFDLDGGDEEETKTSGSKRMVLN
ncbi:sensor histidine kinase [Sphingobacterium corticibacter]|uniref:histidine kinase n=1 Tax=Sphingobacterium corticibacter TaxID=2171749 RepID=A0A2T8HN69_9SPHI|nr:HAMP domain-containing sensor histidine kinase [Sphingobacterium corticibacter]PVH26899.1 hypothetical protein DC487_04705 [Sphingobacterium corticibacter]